MNKIEKLNYCLKLIRKEFLKNDKKLFIINERINEDYTLSEKQFAKLDKKRSELQEEKEAIESGFYLIYDEINSLKYRERMKGG